MSSPAISASAIEAPARREPAAGFFQQRLPVQLILASFFLLTIPMVALLSAKNTGFLVAAYVCLFGTTHFVVTFAVYLRKDTLQHFTANLRNKLLFFVIPILLFAAFYFIGVLRLAVTFPLFGLIFHAVVRASDFNHLNRQSFGVHQLFKARAGLRTPPRQKTLENLYFMALSGLLYCTYLAGGRTPLLESTAASTAASLAPLAIVKPLAVVFLLIALGLLATIVNGLMRAWREAGQPAGIGDVLAYLAFQTMSAVFSMISLPLYAASLAMHYAEYHVLMFPRCFHVQLDSSSAVDRWFDWLRSSRVRFYGTLITISVVAFSMMSVSAELMGSKTPVAAGSALSFVGIFDGLFAFHYFVETLIWRFGDPFWRKDLGLYFAPRPQTARS